MPQNIIQDRNPITESAYFAFVNPTLLQAIPRDAGRVLEIGCGAGAFAGAYRQYNPGVYYAAVELNPAAAAAARRHIDLVIEGDIEDEETRAKLPTGPFDILVMGDVLEHTRDPWRLLTALKAYSHAGTTAVACLPNVAHWSVIKGLLAGQWRYTDEGLLDRTHLRFFTPDSAIQLFRDSGWRPIDRRQRFVRPEQGQAFLQAMAPAIEGLGLDRKRFEAGTLPYQVVIRSLASPPVHKKLRITAMTLKPVGAVNDVRVGLPLEALAALPGVTATVAVHKLAPPPPVAGTDDLVVWQRPILDPVRNRDTYHRLLHRRLLTVVEFDDDPDHWPRIAENDYLTFKAPHAVQVSNEPLALRVRAWNPNVAVFPNQLDRLPPLGPAREGKPLRLFFGALNRESDWAPYLSPLQTTLRAKGAAVKVVIVHDRALFKALDHPHKEFYPLCDYPRYREILGGCDLAWLPLQDTPFNRCKTDLKFLECAAHGVAVLASPVVYAGTIADDRTGLIYRTGAEFADGLDRLFADAALRRRLTIAAHDYVCRERMLGRHTPGRLAWYRSLLSDFERLERERRARMAAQWPDWVAAPTNAG